MLETASQPCLTLVLCEELKSTVLIKLATAGLQWSPIL